MTSLRRKTPGLEILVERLFDHSGTFPPANKTMEQALRSAGGFASSLTRSTMVGAHMVVDEEGVQTLSTLPLGRFGFAPYTEIRLSVLASHGSKTLSENLSRIHSTQRQDNTKLVITSIEMKLSHDIIASTNLLRQSFDEVASGVPFPGVLIAIEPDLSGDNWKDILSHAVAFLVCQPGAGLKCRCTGASGIDANRLAHCIAAVADGRVPFKVTGGLHHPIVEESRWDNSIGFLNLAAAVSLRRHLGEEFPVDSIEHLLENDKAEAFDTSSGLAYENQSISLEELRRARLNPHFSIGSCSLDEPDHDLVRLFGRPE